MRVISLRGGGLIDGFRLAHKSYLAYMASEELAKAFFSRGNLQALARRPTPPSACARLLRKAPIDSLIGLRNTHKGYTHLSLGIKMASLVDRIEEYTHLSWSIKMASLVTISTNRRHILPHSSTASTALLVPPRPRRHNSQRREPKRLLYCEVHQRPAGNGSGIRFQEGNAPPQASLGAEAGRKK